MEKKREVGHGPNDPDPGDCDPYEGPPWEDEANALTVSATMDDGDCCDDKRYCCDYRRERKRERFLSNMGGIRHETWIIP
jgi:hypothetical protein